MAVINLTLDDPSLVIIDGSSNFVSNITSTGLQDDYSNSSNHLNFNLRRNDGADTSKYCLFPQYYNTSYSQWVAINYQTMGGQTFIDNLASWSGITLPAGSNNRYLCIPYSATLGGSIDLTQAYWTSMGNNTATYYYTKPFVSIIEPEVIPDNPSGDTSSDFSGIIGAITLIPATLIVIAFFSVIFKMFVNRRTRA